MVTAIQYARGPAADLKVARVGQLIFVACSQDFDFCFFADPQRLQAFPKLALGDFEGRTSLWNTEGKIGKPGVCAFRSVLHRSLLLLFLVK